MLLTHVHPDHEGAAREMAEAWGCPVFAHPAEIPIATGGFAAMVRYAGPLDRWLILPLMRAVGRRRREAILAGGRRSSPGSSGRSGGTARSRA
jgi:glyoxylase-like metal-dependent hydrolase (beta-lactamase superfamily II)